MGLDGFQLISAQEAEERFSIADHIWYPYEEFEDEQEIRLYSGDVVIDGDFTTDPNEDWNPFNVIVDGNLTIRGNLEWSDFDSGNFLWVTGDLHATAVRACGCPSIRIGGDLVADHGIFAYYGDDGGVLTVEGALRSPCLISVYYFNLELSGPVETLLLADPHRTNVSVDFEDGEAGRVLIPAAFSEGEFDLGAIWDLISNGKNPFLQGIKPDRILAKEAIVALLDDADSVEELDLSDKKLSEFPEELFAFPSLKILHLGNNNISDLPADIDRLSGLEVLSLRGNPIKELPARLTKMGLRVLDLSNTEVVELPQAFGDLQTLEELTLERCPASLPPSFRALSNLERLDLSSRRGDMQPIPEEIFSVTSLRHLSLAFSSWTEIPDELLQLRALEELDLYSALGGITELPDLSALPALRVLRLPGNRQCSRPYPPHDVMQIALGCSELEELSLDRWGERESTLDGESMVVRTDVTLEPDAFSRVTKLRTIDLSFNGLESLPESFFALQHLEEVDLSHNRLDRPTMDRIAETFPQVRFDLRSNRREEDIDDPHLKAVKARTKEGSAALGSGNYKEAVAIFEDVLSMCTPGKVYTDYDELYATYGIVYALGHWIVGLTGEERARRVEEAIKWSRRALSLVPDLSMIWHFTDEGAFHREVTRVAGNALAWYLHEDPTTDAELEEACAIAARAAACIDGQAHWFIYDTQVRALLKSGREEEAYPIVARILHQEPSFGDFQDLKDEEGYLAWKKAHLPEK